jgi:transcriptional regulator with XRE-family HTH domain
MIDGRKRKIIKAFGEQLRKAREKRGLSLRELSAMTGVDHAQIYRIEDGQADARITTVVELADALEVDPGDLFAFHR